VTFSFSFVSFIKIPSIVYTTMRLLSFSTMSCTTFFTMPCVATSSFVTWKASSCNDSRFYTRFYFSSLIWFISWCNCLFSTIATIYSVGGRVLIVSLIFYAFSCAVWNIFSSACSSVLSRNWVHTCVLSSYDFLHSSSKILILSTVIMVVFPHYSLSFGGVLGIVQAFKYTIFVWNPWMDSLLFVTLSYKGVSTSICTSRKLLYTSFTTCFNLDVFYTMIQKYLLTTMVEF